MEELSGIDAVMRAQALDEGGIDATMIEGLHLAYGIQDALLTGDSPLHRFLALKRKALVDAFKALPSLRPTDIDSIVTLQRGIEQYLDLANFLTTSVGAVQSPPDADYVGDDSPPFDAGEDDGQGTGPDG